MYYLVNFIIIDTVIHVLAIPLRVNNTSISHNPQMLRSDGLLQTERVVNLVYIKFVVLINKSQNFNSERVSQGSKNFRRDLELVLIDLNSGPLHFII